MSAFTEALIVTPLSDGTSWVIVSDFGYDVGVEDSGERIEVEKGFVTDFASVPRVLWWIIPKWGVYGNAAVIHDWLYWEQSRTREQSDRIMLEAMNVLGVSGFKKTAIFGAVRIFGTWAWYRNKWDKKSGFNRVLANVQIKYSVSIDRPGIFKKTLERIRVV